MKNIGINLVLGPIQRGQIIRNTDNKCVLQEIAGEIIRTVSNPDSKIIIHSDHNVVILV